MQGRRTFTGDANIRPGLSMDTPADTRSQHASSSAAPAKQPASTQSAFTMGSGAAPISPSKKRMHKDLKMKQTAASSPSIQPGKTNPFAQYGVNSGSSTQPSRSPSQRSPGKAQLGPGSPRRFKVTLKGPNTAQSMHIDSGSVPPGTASLSGMSPPAAAPHNHSSTTQPAGAPFPPGTAGTSTGFSQIGVPANPFTSCHAPAASFAFKPAVSGTATNPAAPSASSGPPNIGARPDASLNAAASAATSAATASPAAVTPPSFRFGASGDRHAAPSSPQVPFQGFGAAAANQHSADSPTASFAGFQPGVQSQRTPGLSTARKVLRTKNKAGTPPPPGTPMSAFSQGTPLTPMDISPQPDATASPSAPTPPPQPQFTPAWSKPPAAPGNFSFSFGMTQPTPERAAQRQSPRTRRQSSKPAADLPKSRFMPQDATDTSAASAPVFQVAGQSQPPPTASESSAPGSGAAGQGQCGPPGSAGSAPVFASKAQFQRTSAGSVDAEAAAGMGTSAGTAGSAASASATQHSAQPTFRDGFASSSSSQAAPSSVFPSSASMSAAPAFPFSVPGRPMDSRIKDACAMGFMGINLDSASGSAQDASSSSQMPPNGTASGRATAERVAATAEPSSSTTAQPGTATAGWGSATAGSSIFAGPPPPAFSHFQPSLRNAFTAGPASSDKDPSANHQVPQGDPPPAPFSFNLGTEPNPKQKTSGAMFGSKHVATNLHDKLVLEEEGSAAGAEPAATSGTSSAAQMPHEHQHAASASTSDAAAGGTSARASAPATNADAVPPAAAPVPPANSAASVSASGTFPAFTASTSAAPAAAQPSFVFGAKPAAAAVSQPSRPHTFSFGTTASSSGFPPCAANTAAPGVKPFVFGAKPSAAAAQAAANSTFPPPKASQAAAQEAAAQPAVVSTALPHLPGRSAASQAAAAAQSMPMHSSAVPRNVLHSPSGIAKHTGPGRHGRAVPGSPGARRSARASPGKQLNGDDRPAGLPSRWTPVHSLADPTPAPQPWLPQTMPSTHEQAATTGRQHQAPAPQAEARHSATAQPRPSAGSTDRVRVEAAAEQHRQKGNLLFAKPDFIGAGQGYTKGLNVLHEGGVHDGHVFVKLLTNRAACHLSLARPLKALQDCTMAVQADPSSVRAATRAATCHLKMGQLSEASQILDTVKVLVTASGQAMPPELVSKQNDLEVTKRLVSQATASLQAASAMPAVTEAQKLLESLSWEGGYCPFSQPLAALNAHALLRLYRFEEAVKSARRHATPSEDRPTALHWPWWVQAQASFLKGDLQQMQGLLQEGMHKLEQHPDHQEDVPDQQQVAQLNSTAQKLLQLKEAGNRAVQASQWQDAITAYSEAITACADAPAVFAAVLHSNRAAAYQGLQQYADAVADNLRARALDPSYGKAYSRLAAVLSLLHLSGPAVTALEQLTEIVRKQGQGGRDPFKTAFRLDEARRGAGRKQPVHHYRLLGLTQACTDAEIRKAYKKCSLRFHPDKAVAYCKFAPALGTCGAVLADRLDIETRVRDEANWLFKCISEANLVLSDQQKRLELNSALDFEERRMFYKNDLYTPPGGSYSFQKPRQAPANHRPSAYARPSARPCNPRTYHHGLSDSDDEDYGFDSYRDSGSNFY